MQIRLMIASSTCRLWLHPRPTCLLLTHPGQHLCCMSGTIMGTVQPGYQHHSMLPAASSMAGVLAISQQLQQNTGYQQNPRYHQNPGHQGQPQQQSGWPICKTFLKCGNCRKPDCRFQHIPAPHHAPAGGLPIAPQQPKRVVYAWLKSLG